MHCIQVSIDSALVQSTEFIKIIVALDVAIENTSRCVSVPSGEVECHDYDNCKLIYVSLTGANLPTTSQYFTH